MLSFPGNIERWLPLKEVFQPTWDLTEALASKSICLALHRSDQDALMLKAWAGFDRCLVWNSVSYSTSGFASRDSMDYHPDLR
jgi:hypothetical protein